MQLFGDKTIHRKMGQDFWVGKDALFTYRKMTEVNRREQYWRYIGRGRRYHCIDNKNGMQCIRNEMTSPEKTMSSLILSSCAGTSVGPHKRVDAGARQDRKSQPPQFVLTPPYFLPSSFVTKRVIGNDNSLVYFSAVSLHAQRSVDPHSE